MSIDVSYKKLDYEEKESNKVRGRCGDKEGFFLFLFFFKMGKTLPYLSAVRKKVSTVESLGNESGE